jgi:hypothetical protein
MDKEGKKKARRITSVQPRGYDEMGTNTWTTCRRSREVRDKCIIEEDLWRWWTRKGSRWG